MRRRRHVDSSFAAVRAEESTATHRAGRSSALRTRTSSRAPTAPYGSAMLDSMSTEGLRPDSENAPTTSGPTSAKTGKEQ
ncbi:hypothetical protein RHA1_ro08857 (plasmid) [Rhodococcus jostii RHA1]|uniref:Uncharacterized protein n=1 Tax=Rhodococcus jostii (strain RHA1) TaxID=101510 RepID=Q0RXT5_RHOJR|nr:hypothetical protein RHA1_ro08857 [Rhodococcus jostii RHA1]